MGKRLSVDELINYRNDAFVHFQEQAQSKGDLLSLIKSLNLATFELYSKTHTQHTGQDTRSNAFAVFQTYGNNGVPKELEEVFLTLQDAFDYITNKGDRLMLLSNYEWQHIESNGDNMSTMLIKRTRVNL